MMSHRTAPKYHNCISRHRQATNSVQARLVYENESSILSVPLVERRMIANNETWEFKVDIFEDPSEFDEYGIAIDSARF